MGHAEAYQDPGPPEEQTRRLFMANTVVLISGVMGLAIGIPLVTSMVPAADALTSSWSPLTDAEFQQLQKATDKPVKVTFQVKSKDGYLPEQATDQFVWAIKGDPDKMKKARPELFGGIEKVPYDVVVMGFTLFSPICPHLGCKYSWNDEKNRFLCPCHGSQFTNLGEHVAGPAQRGLDPLPFREQSGKAEIEWIEYKQNTPDHIVLKYA